ncbi:hypothetical protein IAT38_004641 [Cryptococcus sp. DSM 104549]
MDPPTDYVPSSLSAPPTSSAQPAFFDSTYNNPSPTGSTDCNADAPPQPQHTASISWAIPGIDGSANSFDTSGSTHTATRALKSPWGKGKKHHTSQHMSGKMLKGRAMLRDTALKCAKEMRAKEEAQADGAVLVDSRTDAQINHDMRNCLRALYGPTIEHTAHALHSEMSAVASGSSSGVEVTPTLDFVSGLVADGMMRHMTNVYRDRIYDDRITVGYQWGNLVTEEDEMPPKSNWEKGKSWLAKELGAETKEKKLARPQSSGKAMGMGHWH